MSQKNITIMTGLLLLLLAALSFALSFNSLTALAKMHDVSIPAFIPLLLEGGVVIFALSAFIKRQTGQPAARQWAMIVAASLTATILNVIFASNETWVGMFLHGLPSVFLVICFESFLSQFDKLEAPSVTIKGQKPKPMLTEKAEPKSMTISRPQKKTPSKPGSVSKRRAQAMAFQSEGLSLDEIANRLGVSARTVRRYTDNQTV